MTYSSRNVKFPIANISQHQAIPHPPLSKPLLHAPPGDIETLDVPSRCSTVLANILSLFRIPLIQDSTMKQHCPTPLHKANISTKALCTFHPRIVPNLPFNASVHKFTARPSMESHIHCHYSLHTDHRDKPQEYHTLRLSSIQT